MGQTSTFQMQSSLKIIHTYKLVPYSIFKIKHVQPFWRILLHARLLALVMHEKVLSTSRPTCFYPFISNIWWPVTPIYALFPTKSQHREKRVSNSRLSTLFPCKRRKKETQMTNVRDDKVLGLNYFHFSSFKHLPIPICICTHPIILYWIKKKKNKLMQSRERESLVARTTSVYIHTFLLVLEYNSTKCIPWNTKKKQTNRKRVGKISQMMKVKVKEKNTILCRCTWGP